MFIQDKFGKGMSKLETNLQYEIVNKTDHSCVPKVAGIEVKVNWVPAGKRARGDVPVSVDAVCKEE